MIQNGGKPSQNGLKATLLAVVLFFGAGMSARADQFTFNFNFGLLSNNAGHGAVQTFMNGVLSGGRTVQVSNGAVNQSGAGAYAGEGHVVNKGSTPTYTLAVKDGGFLMNDDLNIQGLGAFHEFDLTFNAAIDSISFDYQIFPDLTGTPTNLPDMEFLAGGNSFAPFPAAGAVPVAPNDKSVLHPSGGETSPQLAPTFSGLININLAANKTLQFIDWPPEIGVANLTINFHQPVPEPASIVLFGSGLLASLALMRRKQRKQ